MNNQTTTPFLQQLANRVECEIPGLFRRGNPSITQLAAYFNVSYVSMWKAVNILKKRGILFAGRGRRLNLRSEKKCQESGGSQNASVYRIVSYFQNQIKQGEYRAGMPLPKNSVVCREFHVSAGTVTAAFRQLAAAGQSHKKGKRWIVGSVQPEFFPDTIRQTVILIAPYKISRYHFLLHSEWTSEFLLEFITALEENGIRIFLVRPLPGRFEGMVDTPDGIMPVKALVRTLGINLRGGLCLIAKRDTDDLRQWLDFLAGMIKPLIWYDYQNTPEFPGNHRLDIALYRNFYKAIRNDYLAVQTAIEALYNLGHRKVGMINLDKAQAPWVKNRLQIANQIATRSYAPLKIFSGPLEMDTFSIRSAKGLKQSLEVTKSFLPQRYHSICNRLAGEGNLESKDRINALACLPGMIHLLEQQEISALMIPHDRQASSLYHWARAFKIDIPKRLSLLSFDNSTDWKHLPVSSVDFGMRRAGYASAQVILEQVSVNTDKHGVIKNSCFIANRASISQFRGIHLCLRDL